MKQTLSLLMTIFFLLCGPAAAQDHVKFDYHAFGRIPVLHEGRVKPLSSFAAIELNAFSQGSVRQDPSAWIAEVLFNPELAMTRPVFKIMNPDIQTRFKLEERLDGLYSLQDISAGLEATQKQAMAMAIDENATLTKEQQALVRLHENALAYGQLLQAMTPFLPMNVVPPDTLGIDTSFYGGMPTYMEARKHEQDITAHVQHIVAVKGHNPDKYNDDEKAAALLSWQMKLLQDAGERNMLLRVIPPQWKESEEWLAPWALMRKGQGAPKSADLLNAWQNMAKAYRDGSATDWKKYAAEAQKLATGQSGGAALERRLAAETAYYQVRPFRIAMGLYVAGLLLAAAFCRREKNLFYKAAWVAVGAAILFHLGGIGLRIFILERPPVGSLYESLLFVSMITATAGLGIEALRRDALALMAGAVAAFFVLFIAPVTAPEGDDLQMLVAVLNTNFWLGTHVLCITAGYGLCLLTACLAHIYLFSRWRRPERRREGLYGIIFILSIAALLFTAVGTVLGGIWADQSWGRFWGWDPKENGALLIVLWLIWLHHGRIGGHLSLIAFNAGLALLTIVVGLAWFGVNLLSVGLHSYGFTSGTAIGLGLFCAVEIAATGTLYLNARRKALP